jgi:hypothetical protein
MRRVRRDERGASLILAIAFLVITASIGAAVIASVTSGVSDRSILDQVRNRQYAADGAIENDVAWIRTNGGTCSGHQATHSLNSLTIHVDCVASPAVIVGPGGELLSQNNIVFTACLDADVVSGSCPTDKTIINAQVNFQGTSSPLTTFVQSWSVNK